MRPLKGSESRERLKVYKPDANPILSETDIVYKADAGLGLVAPLYAIQGAKKNPDKINGDNNLLAYVGPFIPASKESLSLNNNVPSISDNNLDEAGNESQVPIKEVAVTDSEDDVAPNPNKHILTYYIGNGAVQTTYDSKCQAMTTVYIGGSLTGVHDTKEHNIT